MKLSPKEKSLQDRIINDLRWRGYWSRKLHVGKYAGHVGDPDILFVRPTPPGKEGRSGFGIPVAMELKRDESTEVEAIQQYRLRQMIDKGFMACVVKTMADYDEFMSLLDDFVDEWCQDD